MTGGGYTGRVRVGGPSDVRRLADAEIRKVAVGPMDNAAYLLTCRRTGAQLLVDAPAEPDRLLALVAAGADDADAIASATDHAVTVRLRHGDTVTVGDLVLDVVGLRGHTPGSVALALSEPSDARAPGAVPGRVHLFTGDSLFPGGVGATGGDAARFAALLGDVTTRVFERFRDDTWVYPGHGDDTTLGAERPHLAAWAARGW